MAAPSSARRNYASASIDTTPATTLHVVVLRGEERVERDITLVDTLEPYARPFLGLLPVRDATRGGWRCADPLRLPGQPCRESGPATGRCADFDRWPSDGRRARRLSSAQPRSKSARASSSCARRAAETLSLDLTPVVEPTTIPATLPAAREAGGPAAEASEDRPQTGLFRRQAGRTQKRMLGLRAGELQPASFVRARRLAAPAWRREGRRATGPLARAVRRPEPDPARPAHLGSGSVDAARGRIRGQGDCADS